MPEQVNVIVIRNGVVDENILSSSKEQAETLFLKKCESILSNFDEYTEHDKRAILDDGYETFGCGSICISWPERIG